MSEEYARENKHQAITAKKAGYVNVIKEHVEATDELIQNITHAHTQQIKLLVTSTAEAMRKMVSLLKEQSGKVANQNENSKSEKQKKKEEKQRKWREAKPCAHCNIKHPSKADNLCWELEANATSRPANWKSVKST